MHISYTILLTILALSDISLAAGGKVLLTNVKTLTLRRDAKTSHRRVSAIPQLKCIGGPAKGLYEIDVMRCKNQGSDYDDDNIQWSCTASLPAEFRLGATDVICEGYSSPSDPYILKGSCGAEYRLFFTAAGEEKYGNSGSFPSFGTKFKIDWTAIGFWIVFLCIAAWIVYSACYGQQATRRPRRPVRNGGGGFGGWGGGGGGGGGDPYDPPPPYPGKPSQEQWRPGFWSGALGGAAAGYMAGNRGERQQAPPPRNSGWFGGNSGGSAWGGPSNPSPNTRSSSSSSSSLRHESTGFGSTSRR